MTRFQRHTIAWAVVLTSLVFGGFVLAEGALSNLPVGGSGRGTAVGATGWSSNGTTTSTTQLVTATQSYTSTAATGTPSFIQTAGARFCMDNGLCGARQTWEGTVGFQWFQSGVVFMSLNEATGTLNMPLGGAGGPNFSGSAASGNTVLRAVTNGARIDFGAGASDHASSDGTTVTFAGPITTTGALIASGASGEVSAGAGNGVAGSGTGITVNNTGTIRQFVHVITVGEAALAAAATTDITLWTVNARTRMYRLVANVTTVFAGGGLTDVDVTCGTTAGGNQYLLSFDVDTAIGTYGDVAAEIGAGLLSATVADIPSFSSTTSIQCRFTCVGANCDVATAGAATFYLEGVTYP